MHLFGPGPRGDIRVPEGPEVREAEEAPEVIRENPGGNGLHREPLEREREKGLGGTNPLGEWISEWAWNPERTASQQTR